MRIALALVCSTFVSCAAVQSPPTAQSSKDNRIALYLGQRNLDEDDWSPVEKQPTAGLEYVREPADSAVGFEVGLMGSSDDGDVAGIDVTGSTRELYAGVRKTFGSDLVRPYIGGGLSYINAKVEASGFDDEDDSSLAAYIHGGVNFDITESFYLGADLRFLFGSDIDIAGVSGDADYGQLALILGFAF